VRYAVIGAGGVGTLVAVLLARGGSEVVVFARPAAAVALRARGGRIDGPLGRDGAVVPLEVTDEPDELRADVAIVCVKAHQLAEIVERCAAALRSARAVAVLQNGIPWWFFAGRPGPHAGRRIAAADADGRIAAVLPAEKVVGGIVEAAALLLEPGVVRAGAAARFTLGAPNDAPSSAAQELAGALAAGGADAIATTDIRTAVWRKLLGNLPQLPVAALTRATPAELCDQPVVMETMIEIADETLALARAYGCELGVTAAERMEQSRRMGSHLPSMLQDLLAGKRLELDGLSGAALELGALAGVPMPATRRVDGLCRLLEQSLARRPG
jgi:2-dehydropantoate 2-reductase